MAIWAKASSRDKTKLKARSGERVRAVPWARSRSRAKSRAGARVMYWARSRSISRVKSKDKSRARAKPPTPSLPSYLPKVLKKW